MRRHESRGRRKTALRAAVPLAIVGALTVAGAPSSATVLTPPATTATVTPPPQPDSGPGGADYKWSSYTVKHYTFTDGTKDYWTYDPAGWKGHGAQPKTAPLVVFVHGWTADDPKYYIDWIKHLVRKGNVVAFPRYQTSAATPPSSFTSNAISSIKDALTTLKGADVKPETSGMSLVSHSWGGTVSANIANRWSSQGLPEPKDILFANPYYHKTMDSSLSGIPTTAKIDCMVSDEDTTAGRIGCDKIWNRTSQVPKSNRNYVWMFSDAHGSPSLTADHRAPSSNNKDSHLDALDWYGFWKLDDGLRACALHGADCKYALGNTHKQTYMGKWSDGVPVKPLSVSTTKPACPKGSGAKGC